MTRELDCIALPADAGTNGQNNRDDRRRLPSYRDTTSEIISMYGSDSQRSVSSSLEQVSDDMRPQPSPITSCSSRPPPRRKPTATMENHDSPALLQRPRSPFPYPTRLKRPGVRPSSPALIGNGGVDYSRMVAIDRVSYRTVHGSYKPAYSAYGPRQTSTMSSRFETQKPDLMFTWRGYDGLSGPQLSRGLPLSVPVAPNTWQSGRFDSITSDEDMRPASLMSVVDMPRPASCAPSLSPQSSSTFYYDYSEEFEGYQGYSPFPFTFIPPNTVAPIPAMM
ncbi:hypothetical protein QBC47DRAFT_413796, partial [Echria macrotheca]